MADVDSSSLHVVVFPLLAFGHMLPFLELSKSLARRGHHISYISTPRNIQRLPVLPPDIVHLIDFIPFSLPKVEGLPETAEATTDIPPNDSPYLMKALDGLEQPFAHFIKHLSPKPDWIIQDMFQHWIPTIAADTGVPCATYITVAAATMSFYGPLNNKPERASLEAMTTAPPWVPFPSKVAFRPHEVRELFVEGQAPPKLEGVPDMNYRFDKTIGGCSVIAERSCRELECEYLSLLEEIFEKPVMPVGLFPPSVNERSENVSDSEIEIMEWLDNQRSGSVVYVALGSEVVMSIELVHELALGLETAKLPFIWGLRKRLGSGEDAETLQLPEGFEHRTREFGVVVKGWAPQVKILAHESVGGFLTHCGWNSIIEGLQSGRPLVMLPVASEQGLNARLMEEKGIGIEVERDDEDGAFTREDVAKALKLVVVDDEGELYRKRAQEMKVVLANKEAQEKYMEDFVQYLVSHRSCMED